MATSPTKQEVKQIERVQRCALYIILGDQFTNYEHARDLLECDTLNVKRENLCENLQRNLPSIQNTKIGSLKMKKLPQMSPQGAAETRSVISLKLSRLIGNGTHLYHT